MELFTEKKETEPPIEFIQLELFWTWLLDRNPFLPEKQKNPAIKTGFFLDSLIRHNSFIISYLLIISCFRNVKDKNFESDSQPPITMVHLTLRCFRNVKDKNFESDSQPACRTSWPAGRCFRNVKDKNFESDSQLQGCSRMSSGSCFRNVKDKNFESDSQPLMTPVPLRIVVSVTSKIRILKAIHNFMGLE